MRHNYADLILGILLLGSVSFVSAAVTPPPYTNPDLEQIKNVTNSVCAFGCDESLQRCNQECSCFHIKAKTSRCATPQETTADLVEQRKQFQYPQGQQAYDATTQKLENGQATADKTGGFVQIHFQDEDPTIYIRQQVIDDSENKMEQGNVGCQNRCDEIMQQQFTERGIHSITGKELCGYVAGFDSSHDGDPGTIICNNWNACKNQCPRNTEDIQPILDEIEQAPQYAAEDWLAAEEKQKEEWTVDPNVDSRGFKILTPKSPPTDRHFRPLIGRAPNEKPGVEVSAHGYPMGAYLAEYAKENNTEFHIAQASDGTVEIIDINKADAHVLFEGIGVHQGEQIVFPYVEVSNFIEVKNSGSKAAVSGRIEGAEDDKDFIKSATVETVIDPKTGEELLVPKIQITYLPRNKIFPTAHALTQLEPNMHPLVLIIEQDGTMLKYVEFILEVEKTENPPPRQQLGILLMILIFGALAYLMYKAFRFIFVL